MDKKKFWLLGLGDAIFTQGGRRWRTTKSREADYGYEESNFGKPVRFNIFYFAIFFVFLVFLGRLFSLTIISGEKNRELGESNRIRLIDIEAKRGKIFDRNGLILADSEVVYFLTRGSDVKEITENQANDLEKLGLASENFEGELGKISHEVRRIYPFGEIVSHVVGYTSIVQKDDFVQNPNLEPTEKVGRLGVEETYNNFLRGKLGKKLIEVDSTGKKISILGEEKPIEGKDLKLTIDSGLQKIAFEALRKQAEKVGSRKGAVIIQNPKTGEILALVSIPSFNGEDIGKYVSDLGKPFLNRVTDGVYPPGSIFKIVTALSGLESGQITKDTQIEDVGEFEIAGTKFSNWYFNQNGGREGFLKVDRAIARSNDIFFYRVAEKLGLGKLRQMAIKLGFGQKTGIDLPGESYGLVPDEVWKRSAYNTDWYLGDTMHLSIGQGFMLTTPVQVNTMISFAASGKLTKPYLVWQIGQGSQKTEIKSKTRGENLVSGDNLNLVRDGMRQACEKGGTGWPFFDASYKVGCKTGTAEKLLGNPHAWFSAFAPLNDPGVAITVIVEDGGEGSSIAGPVAKEILDWYFANKAKS